MFPETKVKRTLRFRGTKNNYSPTEHGDINIVFCYIALEEKLTTFIRQLYFMKFYEFKIKRTF
jgi:hypothetical protein